MKKIFFFLCIAALTQIGFAENTLLNLKISGMHCGGCETKFKSAAANIKGISEVKEVSAEKGSAVIAFDPAQITAEKAIQSLAENTGFTISATTALGEVQSEGKPSGCCMKGQKSAGCKKP